MIRCLLEAVLAVAVLVVAGTQVVAMWGWFEQRGSLDYLLIVAVFILFVLGVFAFDRAAEEHGWIVHHWWDY